MALMTPEELAAAKAALAEREAAYEASLDGLPDKIAEAERELAKLKARVRKKDDEIGAIKDERKRLENQETLAPWVAIATELGFEVKCTALHPPGCFTAHLAGRDNHFSVDAWLRSRDAASIAAVRIYGFGSIIVVDNVDAGDADDVAMLKKTIRHVFRLDVPAARTFIVDERHRENLSPEQRDALELIRKGASVFMMPHPAVAVPVNPVTLEPNEQRAHIVPDHPAGPTGRAGSRCWPSGCRAAATASSTR